MEERPLSRADKIASWAIQSAALAMFIGITGFAWLDRGWEAAVWMWVPLLVLFGPVIVAVRCGGRSLGKRPDGRRSRWASVSFAPYLLASRLAFALFRWSSRESSFAVIVPNMALGRRLTNWEASRTEFVSVLDVAAEFTEVPAFRTLQGYLSLPVFDMQAPSLEQLRIAVAWIAEARKQGPVYVHCALGHGRSVCMVLAYLLAEGKVSTVKEGLKLLRERRAKVRLHASQREVLRPFETTPQPT